MAPSGSDTLKKNGKTHSRAGAADIPSRLMVCSGDEALAVEAARALHSISDVPVQWRRPADFPLGEFDPRDVALVVDLTPSAARQEVLAVLQSLHFTHGSALRLLAAVDPQEGFPPECVCLMESTASSSSARPFNSEALAALLRERSAEGSAFAPSKLLRGRTVKIETREPAMAAMLDDVHMVAAHDVTVMLVGETGSGKTTLARLFHELSPRYDKSFLHVACGALPPTLIESELFGHARGAFTGADREKIGKFEASGEGTILLDEIDTLSLEQQVKLLRVIEAREFEPVGSNETRRLKARLIVASNVCLETLAASGRFRQDLYYRLNVLKFHLSPLRERPLDVTPLAMEFVRNASRKCGVAVRGVHPQFLTALKGYHWPGNLRELNNCMERAVVLCRNGVLTPACLPSAVLQVERPAFRAASEPAVAAASTLPDQVSASERTIIEDALRRHGYRRSPAAQELGVSRVTLYNKMKKHGLLDRPRRPAGAESA